MPTECTKWNLLGKGGTFAHCDWPLYSLIFCTFYLSSFLAPVSTCDSALSSNGTVMVTWSYLHTGGLPLTSVSMMYTFTEGSTVNLVPVNVPNIHTTSISVHGLTTGFRYTFNITTRNDYGTSSILCGPILHAIGKCYCCHEGNFLIMTLETFVIALPFTVN